MPEITAAPISMGGTIISWRDQLSASLKPLLATVPALCWRSKGAMVITTPSATSRLARRTHGDRRRTLVAWTAVVFTLAAAILGALDSRPLVGR